MKKIYLMPLMAILLLAGCGGSSDNEETGAAPDPMKNKGIGPVSSIVLDDEINMPMAEAGKVLYEQLCSACHKAEQDYIGPTPKDILNRRTPEWVMNMILNPDEMIQKDPIAKALLIEYNGAPMANQSLTQEQARQVLEYFRTL